MLLNLRSLNKQLTPAGFRAVDRVADTIVLAHPSGSHFNVAERALLSSDMPALEFVKQEWKKHGNAKS
jgi:hypothetical protein